MLFYRLMMEAGASPSKLDLRPEVRQALAESYEADALTHLFRAAGGAGRAEYVKAERLFGQYLSLKPSAHQIRVLRATARIGLEDSPGALADLAHAITHQDKPAHALILRSMIEESEGRTREAVTDAEKAVEIIEGGSSYEPRELGKVLAWTSSLHLTAGDFRTANLQAQMAIALDDQDCLARAVLARSSRLLLPKTSPVHKARSYLRAVDRTISRYREAIEYGTGMHGFDDTVSSLRSELALLDSPALQDLRRAVESRGEHKR